MQTSNGNNVAAAVATLTEKRACVVVTGTGPNARTTCGGTLTANTGDPTMTLTGGTIPANSFCTVKFDV